MIYFPNAKINIGLRILRKRPDGYHDIETLMVPIDWHDILEMVPAADDKGSFSLVGKDTLGLADSADNLVMKALRALEKHIGRALPPLDIYLSKVVPTGAGLGGGSADAAFAIKGANEIFSLGLSDEEMAAVAAKVGADCPFFIYNRPMLAQGIGEILTPVEIPELHGIDILVVKPSAEAVSTRDAYAGVKPCEHPGEPSLAEAAQASLAKWMDEGLLVNDFEASIFPLRPQIERAKATMLGAGAIYAAMSGSGASVFGLFSSDKMAEEAEKRFEGCDIFRGKLR